MTYRKLSPDACQAYWTGTGMPSEYTKFMVALEKEGSEEKLTKQIPWVLMNGEAKTFMVRKEGTNLEIS
jgi:hypothetical protein